MNRYVMEESYRIPELRGRLYHAARRDRALALYNAAAWLWKRAKAFVTAIHRPHPARWIERLG